MQREEASLVTLRLSCGTVGLAALLSAGCVGSPVVTLPSPVTAPSLEVEPVVLEALRPALRLVPPEAIEVVDELLATDMLREPQFLAAVDRWIEYWSVTAAPWFPDFLTRMGSFAETVDSALAKREMPASLRYLPLIESGYNPRATSRARAVGLWQFMEGTAGEFGLEVTPLVDERRDPFKSTEAAVRLLSSLHDDLGSWFLALAAYNSGPTRTRRILNRYGSLAERSDSLFWALRSHFPPETRDFVPKLMAAIVVASDPASYGYDARPAVPFTYDVVSVPDATTLDVVARAAEASDADIARLNPELLRGMTPPGQRFTLRVPAGSAAIFEANYALIPESERVSFVEHIVVSGETLSHIARRYRVSVPDLEAANPLVRARYLRIGARLTVPVAPSRRSEGR